MVRLFEPLQVLEADERGTFPSPSLPPEDSPRKIVSHAKVCLQALVRLYYSCHGSDGFDLFIVLEVSFICFAMLIDIFILYEDTAMQEADESSAILYAHILYGQARIMYLSDVVFRVMQQNLIAGTARKLAQFEQG